MALLSALVGRYGCRGSDGDGHASAILPSLPAYPPYRKNPIDQRNPPKRNTTASVISHAINQIWKSVFISYGIQRLD